MKTDARVKYTKHVIQTVFLELLKEKPLTKITVKELCEKSEINRGTFYKHYQDVFDLMEKMEGEALDSFEQLLSEAEHAGRTPVLVTLLTSLKGNYDLIQALLVQGNNNDFINRISERCTNFAFSHLESANPALLDTTQKQYAYSYLGGGTSSIIDRWLKTGVKEEPQVLADYIEQMNQVTLQAIEQLT